jgi:hypothetical protein
MKNKLLMVVLVVGLMVVLISMASAQIESLSTSKMNTYVQLTQAVTNSTYCNLTKIQYPNNTIISIGANMTKNGNDYNYTYFTDALGEHSYITCCNPNGVETCVGVTFDVTPNGDMGSVMSSLFYIGALVILIILILISVFTFVNGKTLWIKTAGFGFLWLFAIVFSYTAWIGSENYLYTISFVGVFFYWVFLILLFGTLPLILGGLIYGMYVAITVPEMKRMLKHGVIEDRALARQIRKNEYKSVRKKW